MSRRFHVVAPLTPHTTIGTAAMGLVGALEAAGVELTLTPTEVAAPLSHVVAGILTREPVSPFDVLVYFGPRGQMHHGSALARAAYRSLAWVPSEATSEDFSTVLTFAEFTPGVDLEGWEPDPSRSFTDPLGVCAEADSWESAAVLLEGVSKARENGVDLTLTLKVPDAPEGVPAGVIAVTGDWPPATYQAMYLAHDLYVSLRGAQDVGAARAGASGCVPIFPDSVYHRGWLMPDFSATYGDASELAMALHRVDQDRDRLRSMSTQAAAILPRMLSWDSVVSRLLSQHLA